TARLSVVVVFATPPFWFANAMTVGRRAPRECARRFGRGRRRASPIGALFGSGYQSPPVAPGALGSRARGLFAAASRRVSPRTKEPESRRSLRPRARRRRESARGGAARRPRQRRPRSAHRRRPGGRWRTSA